eukprot:m.263687 g.263687  ORF g.263687 m.263687 type:complete len:212 (+) comp19243_c2_seq3:1633-2268(+)
MLSPVINLPRTNVLELGELLRINFALYLPRHFSISVLLWPPPVERVVDAMPKKKAAGKKKKGSGKKKSTKKKATKEPVPEPDPPPGPDDEHAATCQCRGCRIKTSMCEIQFRLATPAGIDHPSNFAVHVPNWTTVAELRDTVARQFYQIAGDVKLFADDEALEEEEELSLDDTLYDLEVDAGSPDEPPATVLLVQSKGGARFGYDYYLGHI